MASNGDFPSCSVFSYCSNDPVDGYDPSGMSEFQDNYMLERKKYLSRFGSGKQDEYKYSRYPSKNFGSGKQEEYYYSHNKVQRILYNTYQVVRHTPLTYTQGVSASAGFYNASLDLSMDTSGNIVPQITFSSNFSTSGFLNWSFGSYIRATNAPTAHDLSGLGVQYGGSVSGSVEGVPIFIGLDGNKIVAENQVYDGITFSNGAGFSTGVEGHVQVGNTWNLSRGINVSRIIDRLFYSLIGW